MIVLFRLINPSPILAKLKFSYIRHSKLCKFYSTYFKTLAGCLLNRLKYSILHSPITFHLLTIKCSNNKHCNVFSSFNHHITS
jgi:hypothetical protein